MPSNDLAHQSGRYEANKKILEEKLVALLLETHPQLKNKIDYVASGTPLSNNFYLGSVVGEAHGLSHTCKRFSAEFDWLLRPRQGIKGLFLTGQDILNVGIFGALISGVLTSAAVDHSVFLDLLTSYFVRR